MPPAHGKRTRHGKPVLEEISPLPDETNVTHTTAAVLEDAQERNGVTDDGVRHTTSSSPVSSSHDSLPPSVTFGFYVWTEVGMILFYRFMREIQTAAVDLASLSGSRAAQAARLSALADSLRVVWAVGRLHLPINERASHEVPIKRFTDALIASLRAAVLPHQPERSAQLPHASAAVSQPDGAEVANDIVETCRVLERVLEEHGFPDDEGSDTVFLTGGLARLAAETRQNTELCGYSYSERGSAEMPLLPRYEGEKRTDSEYAQPRSGHTVTLPFPHPHPEINTTVQLSEPKKRRPALDEFRIFSHPKKTTTHGVEDFLVDEELNHRAFVVLRHHLDTHGSLSGLSPYARFLFWNVVLDRDDVAFEKLYDQSTATLEARRRLEHTRVALGARYTAFEEVRAAARDAAQRIGWYAVSAQWRDQALSRLETAEDVDWYQLGDVAKLGGRAVFPNYAASPVVRKLVCGLLEKLDAAFEPQQRADPDEAVAVARIVDTLLLPLLLGEAPSADTLASFPRGAATGAVKGEESGHGPHCQRERRHLKALMARHPVAASCGVGGARGTHVREGSDGTAGAPLHRTFVCPSMLFPIQCLAELFELCSLAQYAEAGASTFGQRLLSAEWMDEEGVLRFLLQSEPLNPAVAPMVALPKVYRDLVTGVQLMAQDKMIRAVVEAARVAAERGLARSPNMAYTYWRALSFLFQEAERTDDLLMLVVASASHNAHTQRAHGHGEVGAPLFTEGVLERARRVWPEDVNDLLAEEKAYRAEQKPVSSSDT